MQREAFLPSINHPCRQCPWCRTRSETSPRFGQSVGWGGCLHCLTVPGTSPERMSILEMNASPKSTPVLPPHTPGTLSAHLGMTQLLLFRVESQKKNSWVESSLLTSPSHNVTFAKDRDADKNLIVYYSWLLEMPFVSLRVLLISWTFICTT